MRDFNHQKFKQMKWDNEIMNYLSQIHECKWRQELCAFVFRLKIL